jgi:hypothetical protein
MSKKIMGREPAASAALKIRDEEELRNSGGPFESVKSRAICTATVRLL